MDRSRAQWSDVPLLDHTCPLPLDEPFTPQRAAELGVSRRRLARLVEQGLIRSPARGVYVASQVPDSIRTRVRSLLLVVPQGVVVTDRTAAWIHGVDALPRSTAHEPVPIELMSRAESRTRRPGVRGGIRTLTQSDVMTMHGLRVTTPLRTALDLGRSLRRSDAFAALCGFRRSGLEQTHLLGQVERFAGERGVVQLRELAPLADHRPESAAEAVLLLHCWDAGLGSAEPQVWVYDERGRPRYRLDVAVPELRLAIEFQGVVGHLTPEQRERDARRRRWLEAHGWYVVELWADDLFGPGADPIAFLLVAARAARERLGQWHPEGEFMSGHGLGA